MRPPATPSSPRRCRSGSWCVTWMQRCGDTSTTTGIGPWEIFEVTPENAPDLYHDGQPVKGSTRAAATMVGTVMWELIQPLDEQGVFARFLAEKGEGVHHIAVATPNFDGVVAEQTQRGNTLPLSGSFSGVNIAYLPTDRDLGVILEIFSGMPGAEQEPDAA